MCGICGIVKAENDNPIDERILRDMTHAITHRGPDDDGQWQFAQDRLGFCHQRLSIIDISQNAHQPMIADNGCVLVFNGEIYNFKELRASLTDWHFKSQSDTEVILALYNKYGMDCVKKLKGMF